MFDSVKKYIGIKEKDEKPFDLDKIFIEVEGSDPKGNSGKYPLRYRDIIEGIILLAATGGGKTSIAEKLFKQALEKGLPALSIAVKATDTKRLKQIAIDAGRGDDVIVFSHDSGLIFNPIQYELERKDRGKSITAITDLLMRLASVAYPDSGSGDDQVFWNGLLKRLFDRCINLLILAKVEVSLINIRKIVVAAGTDDTTEGNHIFKAYRDRTIALSSQTISEEEQKTIADELFNLAQSNLVLELIQKVEIMDGLNDDEFEELEFAKTFFFHEFGQLSDKTKSSITELFNGMVEPFVKEPLLKKCFTGESDTCLNPENLWNNNKVIILDFPIKEYGIIGQLAIAYYRLSFMQAAERRQTDYSGKHPIVFLLQDEFHFYCLKDEETKFISTCRSALIANVCITQNINNIIIAMGSVNAESKMKSLLGNLNTKIFGSQDNFDTNEFASRVISEEKQEKKTRSISDHVTENISEEYLPQVRPIEFTRLKTGGKLNRMQVECFVSKAGKFYDWKGTNVIKAVFDQLPQ